MVKFYFAVFFSAISLFAYSNDYVKAHEKITKSSIISTFVNDLTKKNYKDAFALIHPKLAAAWTFKRFKRDLEEVRSSVKDWKPESMSSFTGKAPQGKYIQATYRLESNWKSLSSVELTAMPVSGKEKIIRLHIRVPYSKEIPETVNKITEKFISAIQKEDYKSVYSLMNKNCKLRFPEKVLGYFRPVLGNTPSKVTSIFYRLNANSIWYSGVNIGNADNPASYIELIISADTPKAEIIALNFKGRM